MIDHSRGQAGRRKLDMAADHTEEKPISYFVPFLTLLAMYCAWIFTLPLFPSLDGPLHLYYASVLGSLLSGSKEFGSYYFIRHVLPPYALHYYFLIAAVHFFGYLMADKLLVCLIFITTAFGFRYLARSLGPSGDVMSLFIIPLLLNWPLGMGFYNYCLAIGMALWALGFWYRAVQKRSHRLWLAFLFAVILMVLTHPVPLLFVYVLVGVDVFCRFAGDLRAAGLSATYFKRTVTRYRLDLQYMAAAWATIGYIFLFVGKHRVVTNILQTYDHKAFFIKLIKLSTLAMFSGSHPAVITYRLSLYVILLLAFVLASSAGLKFDRMYWTYTPATAILSCSLLLMVAIPVLPPVMNGANYFSQRLVIFVWLGVLSASSAYPRLGRPKEAALVALIFLFSFGVLGLANWMIRPVAAQISEIETAPVGQAGLSGLTLSLPDAPITTELNYVPYYWVGARYFRKSGSTLLNGGWLYESYVPLGSRVNQLSRQLTPSFQDSPGDVYQLLLHSPTAREQILPRANLLLFTGNTTRQELLDIVKHLDSSEPSRDWACNLRGWYSDCTSHVSANVGKPEAKSTTQ
ncbi:MAG: hypothetical protein ACYCOR_15235 [Acidobacteriaceae bacterium]